MSQKTIVYANTIDYNFPLQQRPHHIMNILAQRGYKVYWVNNTKVQGKMKDIINPNLEIWHNWDVFKKRVPEIDVYFSSWALRHTDLNDINAKMVIYDSLDNFEAHEHAELDMIKKANAVLTTSAPLYDLRKKQHDNVHMCRNACFTTLANNAYSIPNDLLPYKENGKPIILFSGALAKDWCDIQLVERISSQYQLVFVGKLWSLKQLPNRVIYLGEKEYGNLQAYYQHCDVNILPFKRCQIADFSNPIKNYEAMAHGKLTVATDIPEATIYPNVVLASKNHDVFMSNLKRAIKLSRDPNTALLCKEEAKLNTWNDRVDIIENIINRQV